MHDHLAFPIFVSVWNKLQDQSTPKIHINIARWLERAWLTKNRRLLLTAFRSCGKSTIMGLFCVWLLWQNPNLRILIVAADLNLAKKMVRQVKRIIEKHPFTKHLKPTTADQWGSDRFTLNRTKELRDPSMLAKGISSNLTGTRADIIICDDVEVPKTSDTRSKRDELRERLLELDYILTPDGTQIYVGTPHHYETIYRIAGDEKIGHDEHFLDKFERYKLPIMNAKGQSVWPERFPLDVIENIKTKTGTAHFQSQMMVEPQNIKHSRLDAAGLQFYSDNCVLTEANHEVTLTIGGHKMQSGAAWWDPAFAGAGGKGDESVLAILYTSDSQKYFLHHLESVKATANNEDDEATEQCKKVALLLKQFHVPMVAIETNGIGKFLPNILRREIARIKGGTIVKEITSRTAKATRILESFDVVLAARCLYVRESPISIRLKRQLAEWNPSASHADDDMIDAVAGALSLQPAQFRSHGGHGDRPAWVGKTQIITPPTNFKF